MNRKQSGAEPSDSEPTTDDVQSGTSDADTDDGLPKPFRNAEASDFSNDGYAWENSPTSDGESSEDSSEESRPETDTGDVDDEVSAEETDSSSAVTREEVYNKLTAELASSDGMMNREHATLKVANLLDLSAEDDDLEALIDELAEVEGDDIVGVDTSGMPFSTDDAGDVPTWVEVNNTYGADTGKGCLYATVAEKNRAARAKAVELLIQEEHWISYISMDTGEDDLYYYDASTGKYIKDDVGRLEKLLVENIDRQYYDSGEVREIRYILESRSRAGYDDVNARHMDGLYVNTANCVLRIDSDACEDDGWRWETHEHSPEYRFIAQSVDSAEYYFADPGNVELEMQWTVEWLRSMFDQEDRATVLCEVLGGMLRPDQYFKYFALLTGDTNSGKSTLLNAWRGTIGADNTQGIEFHELAEGDFESSELFKRGGLMMNTGSDIEKRKLNRTSALKKLTSNDYTYHDVKHDSGFSGVATATQVHVANNAPVMDPDSGAVPERLKHLHFPYQFYAQQSSKFDVDDEYIKEADADIEEKLSRDGVRNALLLLALRGLNRLYENEKTFSFEAGEDERWNNYIGRADTVGRFATDCLMNSRATNEDGLEVFLSVSEVMQMYKSWSDKHGEGSRTNDQIKSLLNQVPNLEIYKQRTRRTSDNDDREMVYWKMKPVGEGWSHAPSDVITRLVENYDMFPPNNSNGEDGGSSQNDENGGVSDTKQVLKAIPGQMMRDAGGPTIGSVAGVTGLSPDETRAALGELMVQGEVEKQGDEYHTAATTDGGEDQ